MKRKTEEDTYEE